MADIRRAMFLLSLSRPAREWYVFSEQRNLNVSYHVRFRNAGTTSSSQDGPLASLVDAVTAVMYPRRGRSTFRVACSSLDDEGAVDSEHGG